MARSEIPLYKRLLFTFVTCVVFCPIFSSIGDAMANTPSVHYLGDCMIFWGIALGIVGFICGLGALFSWGDDD